MVGRGALLCAEEVVFVVLVAVAVVCGEVNAPVRVRVAEGEMEGRIMETALGRRLYAGFKGIRYGKAPVGNLRFAPPQPVEPWRGVYPALDFGNWCIQFGDNRTVVGSEDCLFLNVYTTQTRLNESSAQLPVLFFLHGGGFIGFTGNIYGPDFFMDFHDCIVITVQYRLGALGWLRVESSEVTGNMGFKDQTLALRWVQRNIAAFGGDPNRVLIFGESAGSISVHALMFSKYAKGLFSAVLAQSGTLLNHVSVYHDWRPITSRLLEDMNCSNSNPEQAVTCLRKAKAEDFVTLAMITDRKIDLVNGPPYPFAPVVDGDFLEDYPEKMMRAGSFHKVPFMQTVTSAEVMFNFIYPNTTEDVVKAYLLNVTNQLFDLKPQSSEMRNILAEALYPFYFDGDISSLDIITAMNATIQAASDKSFFSQAIRSFDLHTKGDPSVPNYFGIFAYEGYADFRKYGAPWLSKIPGVAHTEELYYQFLFPMANASLIQENDVTVIKYFVDFVYNLAAYGNPTPAPAAGVTWPTYGTNRNYLRISSTLEQGSNYRSTEMLLWSALRSLGISERSCNVV